MEDTYKVTRWNKKEKPTIELMRQMLVKEGLSPSRFDFPANDEYGNHSHDHDEVRVVVEGKMMFGIPDLDEEVILTDGDRLDIKAGTVHYAKVLSEDGVISLTASKS